MSLKRQSKNTKLPQVTLTQLAFNAAQENLETFYEDKTKGIIIRARARWHEHGEKSTKYFLNLEKRNHIKKTYT